MKRFVVIGLGHFGSWAARALYAQGYEVIAVDVRADLVDRHADGVSRAVVGDGRDRALLAEIGAGDADAAIISTGEDLAASILATIAIKDVGVRDVYVKVTSEDAARALDALDVKETIFPEREVAYRVAHRIPTHTVLDYIPLSGGFSIQQIAIPDSWLGKSLMELALPQRHGIQVVAIYDVLEDRLSVVPDPAEPLKESDIALVAGRDDVIQGLLERR